jgi:signal peptide peptidase SppA
MNYQLVSAIRKGTWAIDPKHAMDNLGLVASILQGNVEVEKKDETQESAISALSNRAYSYYGWDDAPEGSVAVVNISGELFKKSQSCGIVGMAEIGARIKKADAMNNISAILLLIDSPGGTVDGTETLANIVKNTEKPIIALVDGLMASAALWVGTSADEVYASTEMDEVGSVGVLLSFADMIPAYEKMGVKFHTITADQSTDKTKMFEDLRAGKYEDYKKEFLNPLAERFISVVKENRPAVREDQLTGKVFFAKDSIGTFIDGIKSIDEAIERAAELGKSTNTVESQNQNPDKTMKNFANVNKALGVDALESVDETASLNEDQLQALDTKLEEGETAAADLAAVQTEKTGLDKSIEEKDALIASQKEEIDSLKKATAGGGTIEKAETEIEKVDEEAEDGQSVAKGDDFMTDLKAVDELSKSIGV